MKVYRKKYSNMKIVLYINSLAEAKALRDAVCTSVNAAEIVSKMDSEAVLFGPDSNLAKYVQTHTDKK